MRADRLAETAALGSLMLDPEAMQSSVGFLRSGDFAHWWHSEIYTVMRERLAAGERTDPTSVGLQLQDRLGPQRAELARIHDLLRAAPVRPHPLRYAAMVLESSLRREVAGHGVLLRAAALSSAMSHASRPVASVTKMVEAALAAAEQRWQIASGATPTGRVSAPRDVEPVLRNPDLALGASRLLAAHPDLDHRQVRENEERLVAALICHPSQVAAVGRWLRPDALIHRPWRATYSALVDLVERGEPVDVVTVAWETQHASRRRGPGPDTATLLAAVEAASADDPGYLGRFVAGDLVRRTADSAARALVTSATNPGVDIRDLFETGRLLTGTVRCAAAGLTEGSGRSTPDRHLQPVHAAAVPSNALALAGPAAG